MNSKFADLYLRQLLTDSVHISSPAIESAGLCTSRLGHSLLVCDDYYSAELHCSSSIASVIFLLTSPEVVLSDGVEAAPFLFRE